MRKWGFLPVYGIKLLIIYGQYVLSGFCQPTKKLPARSCSWKKQEDTSSREGLFCLLTRMPEFIWIVYFLRESCLSEHTRFDNWKFRSGYFAILGILFQIKSIIFSFLFFFYSRTLLYFKFFYFYFIFLLLPCIPVSPIATFSFLSYLFYFHIFPAFSHSLYASRFLFHSRALLFVAHMFFRNRNGYDIHF